MAKKGLRKGIFITFEGVEGCGKSTHARLIYRYLKRCGYPCIYTKEPGGTKVGRMIRQILLSPKNAKLDDMTEFFLFEASRSQIVSEVVTPALKKKNVVICDRFFDATMAYQGYGNGLDKGIIDKMNRLATGGLKPHLTIVLDIDSKKGLYRASRKNGKDRMERKAVSYHKRVRRGYAAIARKDPRRVKLIATRKKTSETQKLVKREITNVISRYSISG
ncbi:MAG: dTMP kinase [Candidatus Omnitrophica bacterium]|nr:dTMP kinase [Candidatus Omnitrophota bacterium]